nr:reverse transcriptase domain-containing protein [Tanacetum cinerariifolium]
MSTRSSARNLFPPLDNLELTIQIRSRADPTLLTDFEMAAEGNGDPPVPDLRTMEELCQPSLNGRVIDQPSLAKPRTYMLRDPTKGNNQGRNQFSQRASHGPNPPPAYQAPSYQAPGYQAPVHQPQVTKLQFIKPQVTKLEPGTFTSIFKFHVLKQLAIKRWDEYGFVIRPAFDSQLKVFYTPLDHDASCKHSKRDVKVLVAMPLYNLEFSDSADSSLGIHITSRFPVNNKIIDLLTFTPPMGDSLEGVLVIAYWFFNPHCPRHEVFYPLDMPKSAKDKHSSIPGKSHGIRNLLGSPSFPVRLRGTNGSNNELNDVSNYGLRSWHRSFNLDNRRFDVLVLPLLVRGTMSFVTSVLGRVLELEDEASIKVNGVTDNPLRMYLFPQSLTHHATAWFDRLPRNSINTFEQMAKMFLGKYFPPSMVTKLKNEITNFRKRPDESLFKAWECYKLSIDRCPKHNMFPVTQIDTFYNGLTLRHRDTINAAAGGTFMKRRREECYDLIENIVAHHNDWDTSAQRSESSSSITSSSNPKIVALKVEMAKINKNLIRVLLVNQQVKAVTPNYETCGVPHSYNDCPATVGQTQNVYAAGAY